MTPNSQSYRFSFCGDAASLVLLMLKNFLLTMVTFGIYYFFAKVNTRKYVWQSTEFAGNRFVYLGTPGEIFAGKLMMLACFVGFILISAFLRKMGKTAASAGSTIGFLYLFFLVIPYAIISSIRYKLSRTSWRGLRLGVLPISGPYINAYAKGILLSICTLGYYTTFYKDSCYRILIESIRVGNLRLRYTGNSRDLLGIYFWGTWLSFLTLGLYAPWQFAKIMRYRAFHTWLGNETAGAAQAQCYVTGGMLLKQAAINFLLIFFTLGLALPFVVISNYRFVSQLFFFKGHVSFDNLQQSNIKKPGALGDSMSTTLDLGL